MSEEEIIRPRLSPKKRLVVDLVGIGGLTAAAIVMWLVYLAEAFAR